jgi:hypothetical protein
MEEEFKLPSPLEMARNRWETLKEMLANPEDFDTVLPVKPPPGGTGPRSTP